SGAVSGLASSVCLQPFDLLKTRVQQWDVIQNGAEKPLKIAVNILRTDGPLGLWRGTTATMLRNVPGVAVYFTGLNYVRTVMATSRYFAATWTQDRSDNKHHSTLPKLTSQGNLLAGATTRTAVGVLLNPFTILKARYESSLYSYNSLSQAFIPLIRAGPSQYLRGALPSALRDAPYAGLFVVVYERIKHDVGFVRPESTAAMSTAHSLSAASAGAVAVLLTHPFDVVKTKMQVRHEARYTGLLQTISTIHRQRGFVGFFDGTVLRMSRKVLSSAIGWAVYEGILIVMQNT
ncbi:solute carrier family 25 member 38, partial [Cristinia sonorae]